MSAPSYQYEERVFLIGMMASGKTTVGKWLAKKLGLDFVDADQEVEERAGADIPWIFDVEGEEGFREREAQVVDALTLRDRIVVATGGGAVLRPENRARLRDRGVVVYLKTPIDLIVARTRNDRRRPLLQGVDAHEKLTALEEERGHLYESTAHLTVSTESDDPRVIAQTISTALGVEA